MHARLVPTSILLAILVASCGGDDTSASGTGPTTTLEAGASGGSGAAQGGQSGASTAGKGGSGGSAGGAKAGSGGASGQAGAGAGNGGGAAAGGAQAGAGGAQAGAGGAQAGAGGAQAGAGGSPAGAGGAAGAAPSCGDKACNGTETCATCPQDCGACPLGVPPGGALDAACTGPGGEAGTKCGGIADAYAKNAVNVGYYPFKIKAGVTTHLHTCEDKWIDDLGAGQGFAVQTTRNPSCSDNPPLRPTLNGFVFGYARGSSKSGWVPADALEFTGYTGGSCADGPANADYQIAHNPYDGCKATTCTGFNTCASTNSPNDGANDCGGKTVTNDTRTIKATDLYMRYAPLSTADRYLHVGDHVHVLYDNLKGWVFVEVSVSTCPGLTPVGSRGWIENNPAWFG